MNTCETCKYAEQYKVDGISWRLVCTKLRKISCAFARADHGAAGGLGAICNAAGNVLAGRAGVGGMKQLVFTGKQYQFRETYEAPNAAVGDTPAKPQKARIIKREHMSIVRSLPQKTKSYKPNSLLNLCTDQCRYSLECGKFCGLKVIRYGSSWCERHDALIFRRKLVEAAE